MTDLTIAIDDEELRGLTALADLDEAPEGGGGDAAGLARSLMRARLAARLEELGLPWAPPPEAVQEYQARSSQQDPAWTGALRRFVTSARVRKYGLSILATAVLVVLWGGYAERWQWTGFAANNQVWDWLKLLLLPVVVGTIPLWIQRGKYVSRGRRIAYLAVVVALGGFVAAGYLIPLTWTGFRGNTLWDWFELALLPAVIVSVQAWPSAGRRFRPHHKAALAVLTVTWLITLAGGYSVPWSWTGYPGNTLWDWLQLLLLPLLVPLILLPVMSRWISGDAAERAERIPARPAA